MFLKHLKLKSYRNYQDLNLEFKTPITILVGNNAQGKSNLLESIYYLATTKSLRASEDQELIGSESEFNHVEGVVLTTNEQQFNEERLDDSTTLEIAMQRQERGLFKKVKVNGVSRRIVDYIGNLYCLSFSPEDINLVSGSPSLRRWHLDLTLSQINTDYKKALTQYGEIITRKNRILKRIREGFATIDELLFWADQQIIYGQIITQTREDFFQSLNSSEKKLESLNGKIIYQYLKNPVTKERLEEYKDKEIWNASSLIGPHRDDFKFLSEEKDGTVRDLSTFGSRGEQRTAVLDLKLDEVDYFEKRTGSRPILLLDDVFSELDEKHRQHVFKLLPLQQTILATVEMEEDMLEKLDNQITVLNVTEGKVTYKV